MTTEPAVQEKIPGAGVAPSSLPPALSEKADILLVDDSQIKLLTLHSILEDLNQNLVTAHSGREALRKVLTQDFAVIILDVHMPELDGFETAEIIRQRPRSEFTPIIFVSAINQSETHAAKGYSLGAVDYIFTPIVPDILRAKVGVFVELARKTREVQRQAALLRQMETREHQRALSGTTARLKIALEAGRMTAWEWDVATDHLIWSPVQEGGFLSAQVATKNLGELLQTVFPADRERLKEAVEQAVAQRREYRVEYRTIRPGGRATWIEMRGRVLEDEGTRIVGVCTDVDERKRGEEELTRHRDRLEEIVAERTEQLQRSEKLASIGTLAAGIAHEINNPLNSILLTANHAIRYGKPEEFPAAFQTISEEAQRGGRIVKGILKFAKEEKAAKTPGDLSEVARHAVDLARSYADSSRLSLELNLSNSLPLVPLSMTEMEQVIINLIKNAAEAARDNVKVTLSTFSADNDVCLTVADDGPGMPAETTRYIFDPFFSTKRQTGGSGLGLSICHGIVLDHGGSITVESKVGSGTKFTIKLPQSQEGPSS
jgi:signal transduction histidine kinase